MSATLQARFTVRRRDFTLDAEVRLEPGEVLALLGPNGSGKSTLLAVIAGLLVPDAGTVAVSGRVLTRCADGRPLLVPPERRGIGLLGQDPLLFPHLSALDNVAFGPQSQGKPRDEARRLAATWLTAVELGGFEQRRPAQLSGGQQQRVALARALAAEPAVLLLDEPMAALDVQTASLMRQLLAERLAANRVATILVTHDVLDAIVLADRVAILQDGRIVDEGAKTRVLAAPRSPFAAALVGVNLVTGTADAGGLRLADGRSITGHGARPEAGGEAAAVFRPADVRVAAVAPPGAGVTNGWPSSIVALEPSSGGVRLRLAGDPQIAAEVSPVLVAELGLEPGMPVWLTVDPADVTLLPANASAPTASISGIR
jgi:molybdate transport system ATP-binding protein